MPRLRSPMTLFKSKFRVESARHPRWNYSDPAWYFVTVCTENRDSYLGRIVAGEAHLSSAGLIVEACWKETPKHFHQAEIDHFVVMPNHLHGIVVLNPSENPATLGTIVGSFKSAATRRCRQGTLVGMANAVLRAHYPRQQSPGCDSRIHRGKPGNWMEDEYFV